MMHVHWLWYVLHCIALAAYSLCCDMCEEGPEHADRHHLLLQLWSVLDNAHDLKHHRDPVVCKHGELVNVMEGPKALALEGTVHITHKDLGSLVKEHLWRQ